MFNRLSLSTRGIVLATAPLVVLAVLVALLILFLIQIQESKTRELHSKAVLDQAQRLLRIELAQEIGSVVFGYDSGTEEALGVSSPNKIPIDVRIAKFCDTCVSAGQPASELVVLRESAIRIAELTRAIDLKDSNGKEINDRAAFTKPMLDQCARMFRVLNSVHQFHTQILARETMHIRKLQEKILGTLMIGLFGSLLLAGLLVRLYATNVKNPLERIAENSRRLSVRDVLLPVMTGSDEFSRLDDVVHAVDDAVGKALARERTLINSAADLICSLEPDTCFSRVSPFAQQMLGVPSEELVERSVLELVFPDDVHFAQEQLSLAMAGTEPSSQFDLKLVRHDGTVVETRWSVFWSQPDMKLFCVVHDITEDKIIERLRGNFLTLISQDLRVPLVSMQRSIHLILGEEQEFERCASPPLSEKVAKEVQTINRTMAVLVNQVNELLEFQSVRTGAFELELDDCEIGSLIEETMTMLQAAAMAKEVKIEADSGSWKVTADSAKVSRVLANFLSNAIRYAPPGTTVSIKVKGEPDSVEIAVADNGPGVPLEFREKIFEAFEQVPGTKGGTGLGLAICKAMIEAHGGQVGVRDNIPSGSVFWMHLPRTFNPH